MLLIFFLVKNKNSKKVDDDLDEVVTSTHVKEIPDIEQDTESESVIRRKQLEKMASQKPEDFAKLLRSWIGED